MANLILQPGPTEGQDTFIIDTYGASNYGGDTRLFIGIRNNGRSIDNDRSILRFPLSLPPGAYVLSATLTLFYKSGDTSFAQTAWAYRCPTNWTELGATWYKYDGVNDWPVNGSGGEWDESIASFASAGVTDDLVLDVTQHVSDALANRDGVLNLLLKTAEAVEDRKTYYSSDEATEITKRPKLEIEYQPAGSRVYFGAGGVEDIDFSSPVAFVPDGETTTAIPLNLAPGQRYAVAARRVSAAGVEEHNTHVVTLLQTDEGGALLPAPLPRPFDLAFERLNADTIRLGFSCDAPLGHAEPTEYRVYGDGSTGVMDYETPLATLAEHVAGRREFIVELTVSTLPLQLAARAWSGAQAGPISPVLVIPASPSPDAPTLLPET
ncbi:MAG: DNRLRE domain-containing protein [Phycisphaerae bacterium]|nr:DNRLRE domain-containing protein [Phycisphaerae bacterium]